MSSSSSAPPPSDPFMKRRRAYVACANCRKRKIKCISVSEVDYRPCTRCAAKGLKCEYFAVPEDYAPPTDPAAPTPEPTRPHTQAQGWPHQPITPPSAGLNDYLGGASSSRRGSRGGAVPPGPPRYPYQPKSTHSGSRPPQSQPSPAAYPQDAHGFAAMQQQQPQPPHPGFQYNNAYSPPNTIPYPTNPGAFIPGTDANYYGQTYIPQQQHQQWPQAM
ncbi:hypothetical protein C8R46DRAFT_1048796 [Mycena filopes]|nr:hypothetical protein C8R46DRAFT_1048796 [Mycena filopes]